MIEQVMDDLGKKEAKSEASKSRARENLFRDYVAVISGEEVKTEAAIAKIIKALELTPEQVEIDKKILSEWRFAVGSLQMQPIQRARGERLNAQSRDLKRRHKQEVSDLRREIRRTHDNIFRIMETVTKLRGYLGYRPGLFDGEDEVDGRVVPRPIGLTLPLPQVVADATAIPILTDVSDPVTSPVEVWEFGLAFVRFEGVFDAANLIFEMEVDGEWITPSSRFNASRPGLESLDIIDSRRYRARLVIQTLEAAAATPDRPALTEEDFEGLDEEEVAALIESHDHPPKAERPKNNTCVSISIIPMGEDDYAPWEAGQCPDRICPF